jgi:hypothetical protein
MTISSGSFTQSSEWHGGTKRINEGILIRTLLLVLPLTIILGGMDGHAEEEFGSLGTIKEGDVIKMKIDLKYEREVQDAVDYGHQPWRLYPKDVAFSELGADHKTTYENCIVISESSEQATVRCDGTYRYIIDLRRLVRPDGIWTVTSITVVGKP